MVPPAITALPAGPYRLPSTRFATPSGPTAFGAVTYTRYHAGARALTPATGNGIRGDRYSLTVWRRSEAGKSLAAVPCANCGAEPGSLLSSPHNFPYSQFSDIWVKIPCHTSVIWHIAGISCSLPASRFKKQAIVSLLAWQHTLSGFIRPLGVTLGAEAKRRCRLCTMVSYCGQACAEQHSAVHSRFHGKAATHCARGSMHGQTVGTPEHVPV